LLNLTGLLGNHMHITDLCDFFPVNLLLLYFNRPETSKKRGKNPFALQNHSQTFFPQATTGWS
jgi:hypothetical protein